MKSSGPASGGEVIDLLLHEDQEIHQLFDEFFASDCARDPLRHGAVGKELVDRLSMHDAANREIARTLIQDMGRVDLGEELDQQSRRHRLLVGELDDISAGVSPRDIRRGAARRFDGLITELRDLRDEQVELEVEHVIPTIRYRMSPLRQERLAGDMDRVRRQATIRPGADRRSAPRVGHSPGHLLGRIRGAVGRARNVGGARNVGRARGVGGARSPL